MGNFFQPGNAKETDTATPSPAAQALARYRQTILAGLLDHAAQGRPSFAQFAQGGASLPTAVPQGLTAGLPELLSVMNQPGAFTATKTATGQPPSTSGFSDAVSLAGLLGLLYQSGALGAAGTGLGKILGGAGSLLHVPSLASIFSSSAPATASIGQTLDPTPYENSDLGMSVDPNASASALGLLGLLGGQSTVG